MTRNLLIRALAVGVGSTLAVAAAGAPAAWALPAAPPHVPATIDNCAISAPPIIFITPSKGLSPNSFQSGSYAAGATFQNDWSSPVTVADLSGTGLWQHTLAVGASWGNSTAYPAAGGYTFGIVGGAKGTAAAPFCHWQLQTVNPGQAADLNWAPRRVSGFAFDVEIKRPGSTRWVWWIYGNTTGWAPFSSTTAGYYSFRSRLRRTSTNKASGFSPQSVVHVR